jgi:tetratricopeptide (TPR) repeat protein
MKTGRVIGFCLALAGAVVPAARGQTGRQEKYRPFNGHGLEQLRQAENYFAAGNYAEAARVFREAYHFTSMQRGYMYDYARCVTFQGDDNTAEHIYQEVLQDKSSYSNTWDSSARNQLEIVSGAHYQLGGIFERRKWWDQALAEYQSATFGRDGWRARMAMGTIQAVQYQNYPEAIAQMEAALRARPGNENIKAALGTYHNLLGNKFLHDQNQEQAIASYQKALEYRPGWDEALVNLELVKALTVVTPVAPSQATLDFFDVFLEFDGEHVLSVLKADPTLAKARNLIGRTPLFLAFSRETAEALIRAGGEINARDQDDRTPLHSASNLEVAQVLVSHGAEINARDKKGHTPLDGYMESEKLLATTDDKQSLDGCRMVIAYLKAHGAKQGKDLP